MTRNLGAVAVYCGSSPGADPAFAEAAEKLGQLLARRRIRVVYGGGHVGLMGVLADSTLASGGQVHGVMTEALVAKEVAHEGLTALDVVSTMHERKSKMASLADAFVMLPGGLGTLEEFLEAATWTQLGLHAKPCGVLNVGGYFDPLMMLLDEAVRQRFIGPEHRDLMLVHTEPEGILDLLTNHEVTTVDKWLDRVER